MSILDDVARMYPMPVRYRGILPKQLKDVLDENDPGAWQKARDWLAEFPSYFSGARAGHGLVLFGPPGTGKTLLACSFLTYLAERKNQIAFLGDQLLGDMLRRQHATKFPDDEEMAVLAALTRINGLVVDDLLRLQSDPLLMEAFLRLRTDTGRPTIVTLNNGVTLPPAFKSILSEWAWVEFVGDDLRVEHLPPTG